MAADSAASLVALGMLTKEQIDRVLEEAPQAPLTAAATGVDPAMLLELAMKGMYTENLELASQIAEALKLSSTIVNPLLTKPRNANSWRRWRWLPAAAPWRNCASR